MITHGRKGKAFIRGESKATVHTASRKVVPSPSTKLNCVRFGDGGVELAARAVAGGKPLILDGFGGPVTPCVPGTHGVEAGVERPTHQKNVDGCSQRAPNAWYVRTA